MRRQILNRYIRDDRGLLFGSGQVKVPRFLLNDLTRYWRTVTVDFVYKQRADVGGLGLRNAKLRMSRKLVFTSGLLRCFFCQLDPAAARAREALIKGNDPSELPQLSAKRAYQDASASSLRKRLPGRPFRQALHRNCLTADDSFLGVLDDDRRNSLEQMSPEEDGGFTRLAGDSGDKSPISDWQGLNELFYGPDEQLKESNHQLRGVVLMRPIGFSTGAIAKADYRRAITELRHWDVRVMELSALRRWELPLLITELQHLPLQDFEFVSFHAPSSFEAGEERGVIEQAGSNCDFRDHPIVLHRM